jgi:exopolyphosphatase/guanosine-5'-triphosphate,3'-diphosphate pyrophosphatase
MRDAGEGDEVRACVEAALGVPVRVLSGEEEASFTLRGALTGLPEPTAPCRVAVFDIGGGSTEIVIADGTNPTDTVSYVASFDVGSVRFTERHVNHDPPGPEELATVWRRAQEAFAPVPKLEMLRPPVGIAGTMTTLAAVALGIAPYDGRRVHGATIPCSRLREVVHRLAQLDLEARKAVPGMEPNRADVIVAGGCIALALLDHWGQQDVTISDRGVRWGIAHELAVGAG